MIEEENLSEERTDVARARDGHAGGGVFVVISNKVNTLNSQTWLFKIIVVRKLFVNISGHLESGKKLLRNSLGYRIV